MKSIERSIDADLCARCPARRGRIFTSLLRGSSYRGREIEGSDTPNLDHCLILVGSTLVADVVIANEVTDTAAAEHDADFIDATFKSTVPKCERPTLELGAQGPEVFCTPINHAVDEFMKVNYGEKQ